VYITLSNKFFKRLFFLALAFQFILLLSFFSVLYAYADNNNQGSDNKNNERAKQAIIQKYEELKPYVSGLSPFITEPSFTSPYIAGKLTNNSLDNGLKTINFVRYLAGLDNVIYTTANNTAMQNGLLINIINREISHTPQKPFDMSDDMYQSGYWANSHGNLYWSKGLPQNDDILVGAIKNWLNDSDASNIRQLGHRRWILDPSMVSTGFGIITFEDTAHAGMIACNDYDQRNFNQQRDVVYWPSPGAFPFEFFGTNVPWSISLNSVKYDKSKTSSIKVTISDEFNNAETFSAGNGNLYVETSLYGMDFCISFLPKSAVTNRKGGSYHVRVEGLVIKPDYYLPSILDYYVSFFSLDPVPIKATRTTVSSQQTIILLGDVDQDGKVTVKDTAAIQKHTAKMIFLTGKAAAAADSDRDGKITVKDATIIQKYMAKIPIQTQINSYVCYND